MHCLDIDWYEHLCFQFGDKGVSKGDNCTRQYSACCLVIFHINSKLLMQIVECRVVLGFHGNCSAMENSCKFICEFQCNFHSYSNPRHVVYMNPPSRTWLPLEPREYMTFIQKCNPRNCFWRITSKNS